MCSKQVHMWQLLSVAEEKSNKRKKAQARRQHSIQLAQAIMAKERDLERAKPQILSEWYRRDDNVIPAVYRLQRIRSVSCCWNCFVMFYLAFFHLD